MCSYVVTLKGQTICMQSCDFLTRLVSGITNQADRERKKEKERQRERRRGRWKISIIFKGVLMCKPNFTQSVKVPFLASRSLYPVVIIIAE